MDDRHHLDDDVSVKQWLKADEWVQHAPCAGDIDFITPPEKLGARADRVRSICQACPVRPECIKDNLRPVTDLKREVRLPSNSMWVAGEWLPDTHTDASRKQLTAIKQLLESSLPVEFATRPSALL